MGLRNGPRLTSALHSIPKFWTVSTATPMDLASENRLFVELEAAVLSPAPVPSRPPRTFRVGWLIKSLDVDSASIRYRCFHFSRVLSPQFESIYFTSANELKNALPGLDAIIIVKRIDKEVPDIVARAKFNHVPVFLDLCDDMIAPGYVKNEFGVNLIRYMAIAPFLAGVTVPSARMAERMHAYAADNGYADLAVHVVPDIAETWDVYRETYRWVTGRTIGKKLGPEARRKAHGPKKVIWFGNFGASHSNFGVFSLKPAFKSLRAVNEEIPLELVIVSNNEAVYSALVHDCGFQTRYVRWSAKSVYSELESADVALLTTGDDDFCRIKSSSRVLQAFAAGVPVISAKGPAIAEFDDAIAVGKMKDALRACLGPGRARFVTPRLSSAQRILERYRPDRVGCIWENLLKSAINGSRPQRMFKTGGKYLIVLEPGDDLQAARSLIFSLKSRLHVDYVLLVSTDLVESQPKFGSVLRISRKFPRFYSGKIEGARNLLLDCSAVVVERPNAPIAKMIAAQAMQLGVPLITSDKAVTHIAKEAAPSAAHEARLVGNPGPFDERRNEDGTVDWAFVVHEKARGWILDAICREIGSRQPDSWQMCYYPDAPPVAKNLFFSHYALFQAFIDDQPEAAMNANIFVWYTHPREENPIAVAKLLLSFDRVTKVIFACESNRQLWLERGLEEEKTAVVLGAADPELFRFHPRGDGVVGLSSSFYERKNPDSLLQVMKLLPHRQFVLVGRNWNQYALFEEMKALPNFTYRTAAYRDYPAIYATFDVFLSMSSLEGGPIPLAEAMMSNAVPVASRTGFAPDLIRHGENGFIFDLDAPADEIAAMIEAAFDLPGNIRASVEDLSWDNFSAEIVNLAE
jgi:glycosyltransferase involved in cell wall biosynthesis